MYRCLKHNEKTLKTVGRKFTPDSINAGKSPDDCVTELKQQVQGRLLAVVGRLPRGYHSVGGFFPGSL